MDITRFYKRVVNPEQSGRMNEVTESFVKLAAELNNIIPDGREKSLVMTKLEEACMWATKAIAFEKTEEED